MRLANVSFNVSGTNAQISWLQHEQGHLTLHSPALTWMEKAAFGEASDSTVVRSTE